MTIKLGKENYMTREEVLKKSREENMGVDVADYEASKAGIKYGWMVAVVL